MKVFKTVKNESENRVITELNARVFSATFTSKEGLQLADIYSYENTTCLDVVAHNTCPPALGVFVETVLISF